MPKQTSIVDQLPEEAREQIIGWLEVDSTKVVAERISQPPPVGFGVKTHVTTLRRFYARHRAETRPSDVDLAMLMAPGSNEDPVAPATATLVSDWAFQIATNPRRNLGAFKAISRWILKQREQAQRDREIQMLTERLELDREKFQFNAARQALLHHSALGAIIENKEIDNEDKINAARIQLFGNSISPETSTATYEAKPSEKQ